ncbi:MAG: ribosomal RNA small subunit methyltransferase A [Proteobacteria bacterium]|nr:ribosomal RNA small subunit methyltransferase A [Pseudomonadota bacterium]NIS71846.1 ribosomal RNA small subunit methyltransferase A [Pseudomonadota bacterium]
MKRKTARKPSTFFPRKRLGQHFLIDKNAMEKIVRVADLDPADVILEIGPGRGEMTMLLAQKSQRVMAVEIDRVLASQLVDKTASLRNVEVICGDALKVDLEAMSRHTEKRMKVVANLPYQISTPLLMRLVSFRCLFSSMVLMLQKEVALRAVAKRNTKAYGSLSVLLQVYTTPTIEMLLPPNCFFPRPKVDSALVRFLVHKTPKIKIDDEQALWRVVRAAFGHRRKTLKNALKSILPEARFSEEVGRAMENVKIDPTRRAETLSLEEFARLTDGLRPYLSSLGSGS